MMRMYDDDDQIVPEDSAHVPERTEGHQRGVGAGGCIRYIVVSSSEHSPIDALCLLHLEQVSQLFADHSDLLMEFTYFLPDAVQEQVLCTYWKYCVRTGSTVYVLEVLCTYWNYCVRAGSILYVPILSIS
jgi:hypothetical protein